MLHNTVSDMDSGYTFHFGAITFNVCRVMMPTGIIFEAFFDTGSIYPEHS
jgi:hypothetical protein